jgi:Tol biopolymer transport system component
MYLRRASASVARGLSAAALLIAASVSCAGEHADLSTAPGNEVASIDIAPPPTSLLVGETYSLVAATRNATGGQPNNAPVAWHSSNESVASVSQGQVTAKSVGTAEISAEAQGKTGKTTVTVTQTETILSIDRLSSGTLGFTGTRGSGNLDLFTVSSDGVQRITSSTDHEQFDGWSPDGKRVALIRFPVEAPRFSSHVVNADGSGDVLVDEGIVNWAPDWLHRGSILSGRMVISNFDGTGVHAIGSEGAALFGPWWSPDGQRVAFGYSTSGAPADIYVANLDGSGLRNITNSPSVSEEFASWAPDGSKLAITGGNPSAGIASSIFIVNADGTGLSKITTATLPREHVEPQWSPDGKIIAFTEHIGNSRYWIFLVNPDGGQPVRLTPLSMIAGFGRWSPDGSRIAFTGIAENAIHQDVFVITVDRRTLLRITRASGDNLGPFWKP